MSLVIYATSTGVAYRVRDEQLTGTLEMLCAQPLRAIDLALGVISFPLGFAVVRAAVYLAIAALALDLDAPDADWAGVLVMLVTAGMAFAPIGILAAAAAIVFKRAMSIAGAIIFAMTFVSGALFPMSVLPEWLQSIGAGDADLVRVRGPARRAVRRGRMDGDAPRSWASRLWRSRAPSGSRGLPHTGETSGDARPVLSGGQRLYL